MIVPDWMLYAWLVLAGLSTLYVAWDNFVRKNPEQTVMKWGWVLITLYMGPIALALYCSFRQGAGAGNTRGADDVGGAIMPAGMIMTRDTSGEAMRAAVDPDEVSYTAPATARGDQPLEPRVVEGVKVFELEASVIRWNILADERVSAYAFNRQVPGPRIELTEGDRVRIHVRNDLPESTTCIGMA